MADPVKYELLTWKEDYSVRFELIDKQHMGLIEMTNELFEACNRGNFAAGSVFIKTIHKAVEYAQVHFYTEEKYMKQVDYPELEDHKREHKQFVAKVLAAVHAFEEGKARPQDLAIFLRDWLLNHIAGTDKKYSPYLAKLPQAK
ncbi:MAG: bacteriohemerythrin [Treponema sp.]|jgi:hemerythrin-like metal-binding protein|nr:bacteriohemerythrin [Treponema sp.]